MIKRIYYFARYNKRKRLTFAIYGYTAFYRIQILLIPSKILQKYWGKRGEETQKDDTNEHYFYAIGISNYVNRIADKTPWQSKCLVRALTAQKLLRRKQIATTLYLGVGKDEKGTMIAHAWLRCGKLYVTGGNGAEYAVVAKFAS